MIPRRIVLVLVVMLLAFTIPAIAQAECQNCDNCFGKIFILTGGNLRACDSVSFDWCCENVGTSCKFTVTYSASSSCATCKPIFIFDDCNSVTTSETQNCQTSELKNQEFTLDCGDDPCDIEFWFFRGYTDEGDPRYARETYEALCAQVGVTDASPTSGPTGTDVVIDGFGFSSTPSENTVKFNGTVATVNWSTPTQLEAEVPQGATTGPVTVTVGSNTSNDTIVFTVTQ